ncbi:ABC transporter substrate-binding protein [Fusobacterium varium]|uniref:ABC transporter substrate-binding protein n=1 Tax=Fusobacterium varium ATCC 27725 TaxID=469618 RepID=A0ABN5JGD1_FUSVA|nr:ABC transporter substrate-binding protein [Fusobacterium varium]AVQ31102.1 ABC transporter substrate-binding protein [Fusobacterium varium ATCC 27725]EES62420.2 ABC transporter, substrate-binding protein, family 5 [Fusobacterium varium ATCC 27725]MCF0169727.1 ABC transporter substrate-binding protein [Fusobacterium varium]MCI6034030.1 ABC transporter substrate-binding protein [Fusobacterium varium]MDY4006745.1 ABC transporter substrate-binding protein [Fusobacterium varium]
MRKYLLMLIFNFSLIFSFSSTTNEVENIFADEFGYQNIKISEIPETLNILQGLRVSTIDPAMIKDNYSKRAIPLLYDTLFVFDENKVIKPNLVKDYKWLNEKELFIELKNDIKFHDKSMLTAKDVKDSLKYLKEYGTLKNFYSEITDIKVLNTRELIIKIAEKDSLFLISLTYEVSSIVKRNENGIIGSGPFVIKSFNGKTLKLERFPDYFNGISNIKKVNIGEEVNESQRLIALFNDKANIALDVTEKSLNNAKEYGIIDENLFIEKNDETESTVLMFGNQKDYSLECRKAIESAIQRTADSFFPKEMFTPRLSKINIDYSTSKAKENINKAGLKNKEVNIMVLNTNNSMEQAEKIKVALEKAGMKVNLMPHQIDSYYIKFQNKDFDLAIFNVTFNSNYTVFNLGKVLLYDIGDMEMYNALQPFLKIIKEEKDKEKRDQVFDKIVQLIYNDLPYIPISHGKTLIIGAEKYKYIKVRGGD